MKYAILATIFTILALCCWALDAKADTTLSHDGEGLKIQGASFGTIRSASLGTKGFHCYSTASRIAWEVKVTAPDGSALGFKMFYNGVESVTYPVSDKFFQFQNSPISKTPTITSVCQRAYSSATIKTGSGVFQ